MAKIYGYGRVSTDDQANSIEVQTQQITGYAMIKGWSVAHIFVDQDVSGSVPLQERKHGAELLEVVAKGDIIITSKLDRAFRSALDALKCLEELARLEVSLHMIDMGGDVVNNGMSKMIFTILAAVAEGERDRIRERIRDVKRSKASAGLYNGGHAPFGFCVVDDRLVADDAQQAVLARMRGLRHNGASLREIAQAAGELGFPMPAMSVKRILDRERESV